MTDTQTPPSKPTILVVDDTPDNLSLMSALLKDLYKVKVANHGERGLRIANSEQPPDLILLD
ncbi:MAG TPA: two-component system response regulator, partial [Pseudorhodoferax sp.]|nr:two-component system response regulator [Pseudorhodoferax sp.]